MVLNLGESNVVHIRRSEVNPSYRARVAACDVTSSL